MTMSSRNIAGGMTTRWRNIQRVSAQPVLARGTKSPGVDLFFRFSGHLLGLPSRFDSIHRRAAAANALDNAGLEQPIQVGDPLGSSQSHEVAVVGSSQFL